MLSFWTFVARGPLHDRLVLRPDGRRGGRLDSPTRRSRRSWARPATGRRSGSLGVFFTGSASIMGAVNYITTVVRLRAPGMGYFQMPLTVWGIWLTAILNALFVPVLGGGRPPALPRPRLRHPLLPRRRRDHEGRRRPDPLPAPLLDLRPPRGLHPHPAGVGHRVRSPVVLLAQARVRLQGHGALDERHHAPLDGRLRAPHVRRRHEPAPRRRAS